MKAPKIVDFAKAKLLHSRRFSPNNKHQVLAVFSSRACLKLAKNDTANRFAANAVAHHMRTLISVVNTTLVTAIPSEPILAIAATVALTDSMEGYNDALKTLCCEIDCRDSVLAAEETEQLCCRLLLLLARDVATIQWYDSFIRTGKEGSLHVTAIGLSRFLSTLLDKDLFGMERDKKRVLAENRDMAEERALAEDLRLFCEGKWINFHHFIEYDKTIEELTLEELTLRTLDRVNLTRRMTRLGVYLSP